MICLCHVKFYDDIIPNIGFLNMVDYFLSKHNILKNTSTFNKPGLIGKNLGRENRAKSDTHYFRNNLASELLILIVLNSVNLFGLLTLGSITYKTERRI